MPAPPAYFDTSVLVKNYVRETGSVRARAVLRRHRFVSSAIAPLEALSAFCRRRAARELSERDFAAILARLARDRSYWELIEVSAQILERAEELIQRTSLRTLDAVHLASVMTARAVSGTGLPLVTGDPQQRDVARRLALDVVWIG
ncbi:MAG: type II toxin-antitoxin system VapC family toxin [Candidatus Rokubacteria bacterium]|nr:type II toxin-antitoxin system VapC family toxin [Candidatus Rokubacteria bacterium]